VRRTGTALLLAACLAAAARGEAVAPSESRWLPPGSDLAAGLSERPAMRLKAAAAGGGLPPLAVLGELAFRSPATLGGEAYRAGLSCATCHPAGHLNERFFVPGLSDRPGNVDVTAGLFQPSVDDRVANPLNIPSLRGVAARAPYGRDGREPSLRQFVRDIVAVEFGGEEPPPWLLDGLAAFLRQLERLPGAGVDGEGRLDPQAGAAAGRGEGVFRDSGCAACHRPDAGFRDGLAHDVGSGGPWQTPGLFDLGQSAPYFHDGRYATLRAASEHFERTRGRRLEARELEDLLAYLEALGRAERPVEPVTAAAELADFRRLTGALALALQRESPEIGDFVVRALRLELGRLHERYPGAENAAERAALVDLSGRLAAIGRAFAGERLPEARTLVGDFAASWEAAARRLEAAADRSLYDPGRLKAAVRAP